MTEPSPNSLNPPQPVLRVVPPAKPEPVNSPVSPTPITPKSRSSRLSKLLLLLGLFTLGFLPTRYEVGGTVTLTIDHKNRQLVTSPIDGIIAEINPDLQPGSKVQTGDKIALLRSRNLEAELFRVQQELNQAKEQLQQQIRKQVGIASQIETIEAEAAALAAEGEMQNSLVTGDRSSRLQVIQSQIASSQTQLAGVEQDLNRIAPLEQERAIPQAEISRMRRERDKLLGDIAIAEQERAAFQQTYADDRDKLQIQAQTQNKIALAQQQVLSAEQEVQLLQAQIQTLEQRRQSLQGDRQGLTLYAQMDGEITQTDSIPKAGQELKQGQSLVQIIHRQGSMLGLVDIPEPDIRYVKLGQPFHFRPTQNKLRIYQGDAAIVQGIEPTVKATDPTGQKKVVRVAIEVQNQDGELLDGSTGYARIYSEDMIWYQRIWRELEKNLGFERI